jgi:uncharacterized membrane protein
VALRLAGVPPGSFVNSTKSSLVGDVCSVSWLIFFCAASSCGGGNSCHVITAATSVSNDNDTVRFILTFLLNSGFAVFGDSDFFLFRDTGVRRSGPKQQQ